MTKSKSRPTELAQAESIVLVGLMGAGKTTVGRKLAGLLDIPFVDADQEIEKAAGCTIEDFFDLHGEEEFRKGEVKVIKRLLKSGPQVLATGGGAFMSPAIREAITKYGTSVWLRADIDVLQKRTGRRGGRPLLKGKNVRDVLSRLIETRYPVYGTADVVVDTNQESIDLTAETIVSALKNRNQASIGQPEENKVSA